LAQDATTSISSTTVPSTAQVRVPRTTATPDMIDEAVQRSKARHDRFLATGKPEQWGSEEPFAPTRK
jgi:SpoVK/Ycf46/Vps4 family AAA+-type ATPase